MKKLLSTILFLSMLVTLNACGSGEKLQKSCE